MYFLLSCIGGKLSVSLGDITIVSVIGGTRALEVPDKEMLLGLTEPAIAVILEDTMICIFVIFIGLGNEGISKHGTLPA